MWQGGSARERAEAQQAPERRLRQPLAVLLHRVAALLFRRLLGRRRCRRRPAPAAAAATCRRCWVRGHPAVDGRRHGGPHVGQDLFGDVQGFRQALFCADGALRGLAAKNDVGAGGMLLRVRCQLHVRVAPHHVSQRVAQRVRCRWEGGAGKGVQGTLVSVHRRSRREAAVAAAAAAAASSSGALRALSAPTLSSTHSRRPAPTPGGGRQVRRRLPREELRSAGQHGASAHIPANCMNSACLEDAEESSARPTDGVGRLLLLGLLLQVRHRVSVALEGFYSLRDSRNTPAAPWRASLGRRRRRRQRHHSTSKRQPWAARLEAC